MICYTTEKIDASVVYPNMPLMKINSSKIPDLKNRSFLGRLAGTNRVKDKDVYLDIYFGKPFFSFGERFLDPGFRFMNELI